MCPAHAPNQCFPSAQKFKMRCGPYKSLRSPREHNKGSCCFLVVAPIMLPTPVALRKGGNEIDLTRLHTRRAHSGTFLCCYRCYLMSWAWEQRTCESTAKVLDNPSASATASVLLQQKETQRRCNVRADTTWDALGIEENGRVAFLLWHDS